MGEQLFQWVRRASRDGDLPCFVMRENFLIIFIQIFLINSLIFLDERARPRLGDGEKV